jgi:Bardet-Biedl syndrome 1 protein
MAISGAKLIDYRIVCACRDGNVYTIKNGELSGVVIELESLACGIIRLDKLIVVGCMNNVVHAFTLRGKPQYGGGHFDGVARLGSAGVWLAARVRYSIYLPEPIVCMELLSVSKTRTAKGLLLGLTSGEVRLYNEKSLIAQLRIEEPLTAMRFGTYGREESALALVGASGALTIKMLQRQADLSATSNVPGPPPEQDVPLSIPKKTKLYVEQTQRERDQAVEMHRMFQRDLCKLRLSTARAYVKIITDGQGPMSYSSGSALRLTAQVQGLGPRFKIHLTLQNTGAKIVTELLAVVTYNALLYKLAKPIFEVPLLLPGLPRKIDVDLECTDENGGADAVKVFVCSANSNVPVLSAVVNMPVSEMLLASSVS